MTASAAGLNDGQRRAVDHGSGAGTAAPPLLIIAGAGSGKTMTLAHRVARLVLDGVDPRRILLLTFSRRAAQEMIRRVEAIARTVSGPAGEALAQGLDWAGTFHAVGARLIREHAPLVGLDPGFTIHDREDSADLMNVVRHELGLSRTENRFPAKGTCLAIYSRAVNAEAPLPEVLRRAFPWCVDWAAELERLFAAYVEAKQAQNVLDYDDLLLWWAEMLGEAEIRALIAERYDHVLVDEYQDTNRLQARILLALKPDGQGLTVVGDDAQSIYSFRAAAVENILSFPACFTPPAEIVTLDRNYRSTAPILDAANAVIALAPERFAKTLWTDRGSARKPRLVTVRDEADQARFVAGAILENREAGVRLKSQAVLFRASHHSAALEVELVRRNIPFVKFGGLKFLDSAHVKDMLAALRFAENPRDRVAGFRLLQILPGLGPVSAARLLDAVGEAWPAARLAELPPPGRGVEGYEELAALIDGLAAGATPWPGELDAVRAWYEPHLSRLHEDAEARSADLGQLVAIAAATPSRQRFLTELTLDPPDATSARAGPPMQDEDYLILSTIHSAKGQEWRSVFLLNAVDGCIPSDLATGTAAEIEEERRLLYVAMTRARDSLDLVLPQRFFTHQQTPRGDRHVYAARSRFIPPSLLGRFEAVGWPPAGSAEATGGAARPVAPVDMAARMRGMWRTAR